jgi:hypothetical protein
MMGASYTTAAQLSSHLLIFLLDSNHPDTSHETGRQTTGYSSFDPRKILKNIFKKLAS